MSGKRTEIRLSGSGGQGVVLASVILAEAAALQENKHVTQSQSYGPEARGGATKSDTVISDSIIEYPKATNLDVLLSLTQESCFKYYKDLRPDGLLIVDEDAVKELPPFEGRIVKLPFIRLATEQVGKSFVANIVALGALIELTGIVRKESLRKAVLARVPKGTEALNNLALDLGVQGAAELAKAKA